FPYTGQQLSIPDLRRGEIARRYNMACENPAIRFLVPHVPGHMNGDGLVKVTEKETRDLAALLLIEISSLAQMNQQLLANLLYCAALTARVICRRVQGQLERKLLKLWTTQVCDDLVCVQGQEILADRLCGGCGRRCMRPRPEPTPGHKH